MAKNPYERTVYGVGYLGLLADGTRPKTVDETGKTTREYRVWTSMLARCYSEKYHEKKPTYQNVTVCDIWHCYANFLEDLPKIKNYELWRDNPKQKIALNKDKYYAELGIITDCKEYSLETVRFISNSENVDEMLERQGTPTPKRRVKCIETGIVYESIHEASRQTGINIGNITSVCQGKRKTCGGFHWEYEKE